LAGYVLFIVEYSTTGLEYQRHLDLPALGTTSVDNPWISDYDESESVLLGPTKPFCALWFALGAISMVSQFEQNLKKYVAVIVRAGLNLRPGQRLLIVAPIEVADFVRLLTAEAYQAQARLVDVIWMDEHLDLIRYQYAPRDSFEEFTAWQLNAALDIAEAGDAILYVAAFNPDLLGDQDPELVATVQQTHAKHWKPYRKLPLDSHNWIIVAGSVDAWATKVFPDLAPPDGKAKLWDIIFDICRIKEADPMSTWLDHVRELRARCESLNRKRYTALRLTAPGTDLTVTLPRKHLWKGGRETTEQGFDFTANIPTEEVFTIPHRDGTEGTVTSTKPLSYSGVLIEDFCLTLSRGRVVKASAGRGEAALHKLLEMDDGASRLGEVALVPHSSAISQSGLVFYNTLIDENASSHLALGRGFKINLAGGNQMSDEEFAKVGGNFSLIHVDFMVGSDQMDVAGILDDGRVEPIMRNGEWVFD
jgi:aminopeptidase